MIGAGEPWREPTPEEVLRQMDSPYQKGVEVTQVKFRFWKPLDPTRFDKGHGRDRDQGRWGMGSTISLDGVNKHLLE